MQSAICPNCFAKMNTGSKCARCGYDTTAEKAKTFGALPPFTSLNNKYVLGRVLGAGGFGITYIAKDINTNRLCAIKEYMPREYAERTGGTLNLQPFADTKSRYVFAHGREKFIEEARILVKLKSDPIIVDILDYFTANNTGYLVMEYLDGQDLRHLARSSPNRRIDVEFAKQVFVTVASALMEIHKLNILHRDLTPENIFVTRTGAIKLIDFGAARNFVSTQNKGMSILLKPGFAPPEQYETKGKQGPWTDVYGLCATFYNVVSGTSLVDAIFRGRGQKQPSLLELGVPVTKKTSDVIDRGLALDYTKRYPDFRSLLDDIDITVSQEPIKPPPMPEAPGTPPVSGAPKPLVSSTPKPSVSGKQRPSVPTPVQPAKEAPAVYALSGTEQGKFVQLSNGAAVKIGRSDVSCDLVIPTDTNVSRLHCYVRYDAAAKKFYVKDVSVNGTYLQNGLRLPKNREYAIAPGTAFYLATPSHMFSVGLQKTPAVPRVGQRQGRKV